MEFTAAELTARIAQWLWPFARISGFVMAAPLLGHRAVPSRVKIGLIVILTLALASATEGTGSVDPLGADGMLEAGRQVAIGLALGFAARLVFVILEVGGQLVAQLMGLGFASLVDPHSGTDSPLVSQFYILLASLVFLGIDGHLVLIEVLAASFTALPVGGAGIEREAIHGIVAQAGWLLRAAVVMALPAVVTLLTVNLAFGVMTKTSPQLNIFAVGFPVSLVFGFAVMILTLPVVISRMPGWFDLGLRQATTLMGVR